MQKVTALLLLTSAGCFAWDVGFDFRSTLSLVTDPEYAVFVTPGTTTYPTTRTINGQTVTFGWETQSGSLLSRDRGSGVDPRLAGINCQANDGSTSVFRVDLPSPGTFSIGVALGDGVGNNSQNNSVAIESTNSPVLVLAVNTGFSVGDAAGNQWPYTAWPGSNVTVQRTFGTNILRVILGGSIDSNLSCINHLRVTLVPAVLSFGVLPQTFLIQ